MIKTLKIGMWVACMAINIFGVVLLLKTGKTPGAIYGAFVIATLALNRPSINFHAIQTSRPVFLMYWLWRQSIGRA